MEQDDARHGAKMASSATSTGSGGAGTMTDNDVDMEEADMTQWTEAEFEEKCTYIVKDTACEAGPDGDAMMMSMTRAEASLPRNLAFKHLAGSKEVRLSLTLTNAHTRAHAGRQTNFLSSQNISYTLRQRKASVHTHNYESDMGHVIKKGSGLIKLHTHTHTEAFMCAWVCETSETDLTYSAVLSACIYP